MGSISHGLSKIRRRDGTAIANALWKKIQKYSASLGEHYQHKRILRDTLLVSCKKYDFKLAIEHEEAVYARKFDSQSMATFTHRIGNIAETESQSLILAIRKTKELSLNTYFEENNSSREYEDQLGTFDEDHSGRHARENYQNYYERHGRNFFRGRRHLSKVGFRTPGLKKLPYESYSSYLSIR